MDIVERNKALAREVGRALKSRAGATLARLNYVGTGSQAHRRQLFVRFPAPRRPIDLWFLADEIQIGGVLAGVPGMEALIRIEGRETAAIIDDVVGLFTERGA